RRGGRAGPAGTAGGRGPAPTTPSAAMRPVPATRPDNVADPDAPPAHALPPEAPRAPGWRDATSGRTAAASTLARRARQSTRTPAARTRWAQASPSSTTWEQGRRFLPSLPGTRRRRSRSLTRLRLSWPEGAAARSALLRKNVPQGPCRGHGEEAPLLRRP